MRVPKTIEINRPYCVIGIAIPDADRLRHCITASPVKIASAIQIDAKVMR
jgi:hypothetical protein